MQSNFCKFQYLNYKLTEFNQPCHSILNNLRPRDLFQSLFCTSPQLKYRHIGSSPCLVLGYNAKGQPLFANKKTKKKILAIPITTFIVMMAPIASRSQSDLQLPFKNTRNNYICRGLINPMPCEIPIDTCITSR